jgi:tetratricopeptide (TPR) repeat protein
VAFGQASTLDPDYADYEYKLGITLNELKRYTEALTHFERIMIEHPDYTDAYGGQGFALMGLQRYEEALAA